MSNAEVRRRVNEQLTADKAKPLTTLSEFHKKTRIDDLSKLITIGNKEQGTQVTLNPHTLEEMDHGKKRVSHPRLNWYQVTLQDLCTATKKDHLDADVRFAATLDI